MKMLVFWFRLVLRVVNVVVKMLYMRSLSMLVGRMLVVVVR